MSKIKIIHILCHLPLLAHKNLRADEYFNSPEKGKFHKLNYPPYWVGFFIDHNVFAARDLLEMTNEFELECWRPYGYGLREPHEEIVNGIKHRVFPAYQLNFPQFGSLTWSNELYRALIKEIEQNRIIVNISVGHAWFHIKLMLKLQKYKSRFGIVLLHRGSGLRKIVHKQLSNIIKKTLKLYYLFESYIDLKSLEIADHYYVQAKPESDYLAKNHKNITQSFFTEGINFSKYKVLTVSEKRNLRKELKLPSDKKILIAYGNWSSNSYSYQYLLEVFREIKKTNKGDDLALVMIGGYKSQDLYEVGISVGAIMVERVDKLTFIKYMEASDFFAQACFSWSFINFGGFGTAMIEALACGLPVISGNIIHFPGTLEERKQLGMDMPDKETLKANIIYIKNNLNKFLQCRELAQKYYDINKTRMVLLNKYRELAMKYFNEDTSILNSRDLQK